MTKDSMYYAGQAIIWIFVVAVGTVAAIAVFAMAKYAGVF